MSTRDLHQPQEPSVGRNWWSRWIRGENESSLALSLRSLSEISPFHLVLNPNGVIRHCGPSLQKLMGRNPSQLSLQSCLERGDDMGGRSPVSMQQLNELQHQCLQLHLIDNKDAAASALLSVSDRRVKDADNKIVQSGYQKLRGRAHKEVMAAMPGVADVMSRYA